MKSNIQKTIHLQLGLIAIKLNRTSIRCKKTRLAYQALELLGELKDG
ncbi:hypothetical protein ACFSTE_15830 [Aquimarina hainanensis]|uniref:Transposase n=1 Tax=Aquimarina hainanensis TaxID=1578017 RepID=A0ABW5NCI9_9FLAO